jgi:hypothetical protein
LLDHGDKTDLYMPVNLNQHENNVVNPENH